MNMEESSQEESSQGFRTLDLHKVRKAMDAQVTKKVFISVLVLAVCLIIILAALIVTLRVHRSQQTESKETESFRCFEEKYTNISTPEAKSELMKQKAFLFENETSRQICIKSSVVFTDIVSKILARSYNSEANPENVEHNLKRNISNCTTQTRPQTILQLNLKRSTIKTGGILNIDWKLAILSGDGLRYLEKERAVLVQKTGHYFIDVHLTIRRESRNIFTINHHVNGYKVIRIQAKQGREVILLERLSQSCQLPCTGCGETISNGAVFELTQNDKVYVDLHQGFSLTWNEHDHLSMHEI